MRGRRRDAIAIEYATRDRAIKLIGHRGARGMYPENTLAGFDACLRHGVMDFELDVGVTKDGVAVVHHNTALDPDITRGADGRWIDCASRQLLRDLSFPELQCYDVGRVRPGSPNARRFPHQHACDGSRIPALTAVLGRPARHFVVEIKHDPRAPAETVDPDTLVKVTLQAIEDAGAADRVTVESFDWGIVRRARAARPNLPRAWLTEPTTLAQPDLWGVSVANHGRSIPRAIVAEGGGCWAAHHASLTRDQVDEARRLGIEIIPWTVNETARISELAGWGIDTVITDYPVPAFHADQRLSSAT